MLGAVTIEELDLRYGRRGLNTGIHLVQDWTLAEEGVEVEIASYQVVDGFLITHTNIRTPLTREHTLSWSGTHSDRGTDDYIPATFDTELKTYFATDTGTWTDTDLQTALWTEVETLIETYQQIWTASAWIDMQDTVTQTVTSWDEDFGGWVYPESYEPYWSENIVPQNALTDVTIQVPVTFIEQWLTDLTFFETGTALATTHRTTSATTEWFTDTLTWLTTVYTGWEQLTALDGSEWRTQVREQPEFEFEKITWLPNSTHLVTEADLPL